MLKMAVNVILNKNHRLYFAVIPLIVNYNLK